MKLLTSSEQLLVNGARASNRPEGLNGISDLFIKTIADSINKDLERLISNGVSDYGIAMFWNKRVGYFRANPDLYGAILAQVQFPAFPQYPGNSCCPCRPY